jgi:hypothetical protein
MDEVLGPDSPPAPDTELAPDATPVTDTASARAPDPPYPPGAELEDLDQWAPVPAASLPLGSPIAEQSFAEHYRGSAWDHSGASGNDSNGQPVLRPRFAVRAMWASVGIVLLAVVTIGAAVWLRPSHGPRAAAPQGPVVVLPSPSDGGLVGLLSSSDPAASAAASAQPPIATSEPTPVLLVGTDQATAALEHTLGQRDLTFHEHLVLSVTAGASSAHAVFDVDCSGWDFTGQMQLWGTNVRRTIERVIVQDGMSWVRRKGGHWIMQPVPGTQPPPVRQQMSVLRYAGVTVLHGQRVHDFTLSGYQAPPAVALADPVAQLKVLKVRGHLYMNDAGQILLQRARVTYRLTVQHRSVRATLRYTGRFTTWGEKVQISPPKAATSG